MMRQNETDDFKSKKMKNLDECLSCQSWTRKEK